MMALDQCVPSTADEATARAALDITHRWAVRSLIARGDDSPQSLFADHPRCVDSGNCVAKASKRFVGCRFDGFAIGGLAVG